MLLILAQTSAEHLSSALAVLSAMITPAVLILGSSSLIAATSMRLSRILDRSRKLAEQLENLLPAAPSDEPGKQKVEILIDQLRSTVRRALLLQRAMTSLYLALGAFVATSVTLGIDAALNTGHTVILILLGLVGAGFLFYSSILLVLESRLAILAVRREMDFIGRLAIATVRSGKVPEAQPKANKP